MQLWAEVISCNPAEVRPQLATLHERSCPPRRVVSRPHPEWTLSRLSHLIYGPLVSSRILFFFFKNQQASLGKKHLWECFRTTSFVFFVLVWSAGNWNPTQATTRRWCNTCCAAVRRWGIRWPVQPGPVVFFFFFFKFSRTYFAPTKSLKMS